MPFVKAAAWGKLPVICDHQLFQCGRVATPEILACKKSEKKDPTFFASKMASENIYLSMM